MRRNVLKISSLIALLGGFVIMLFLVHSADADRYLFGSAERLAHASRDIRSARDLRNNGIKIVILLRDGTHREILLQQFSAGLNPDESFQFYRVPTSKQIMDHQLRDIPVPAEGIIDDHAIAQFLKQSLADVLHEPTDARYVIEGKRVVVADEAPGQDIDADEVSKAVARMIQTVTPYILSVSTYDSAAAIHKQQLLSSIEIAKAISSARGLLISYGTYSWRLSGTALIPMLGVSTSTGSLIVNESKLYPHIKTLANSLITEPMVEPLFAEKEGRLVVMKNGSIGRDIDIHGLARVMNEYISEIQESVRNGKIVPPTTVRYQLRLVTTSPRLSLSTLQKMGITDLVGIAKTSFKGSSADRIHNITLGAKRVSGFIVDPGEEFSLVSAIGYSEKENGYKEEYVIKGDRSRKEAGGGLCQVGTTFFRAALEAGLNITERHNHRYVVGYYGPGLDAGIYAIDHDFRFINDFATPLLVQATPRGSELVVEFFSKSDERKSVTTKPLITKVLPPPPPDYRFSSTIPFGKTECTDHPREGLTSYATTTIRYSSGDVVTKVWKSEYTPWPKICLIGTRGLNIYQQED